MKTIEAVVTNGVIRPLVPTDLVEGQTVQVSIPDTEVPDRYARLVARFARWEEEDKNDPGFDETLFENMNKARGAGRIPFPPEMKGITW